VVSFPFIMGKFCAESIVVFEDHLGGFPGVGVRSLRSVRLKEYSCIHSEFLSI
jgi:hypothetical protein